MWVAPDVRDQVVDYVREWSDKSAIFEKGDQGPHEIFTNTTWVKMLHPDEDGAFDTQVYNVTFEPAARTYWHSHPGGQILLITEGIGYYQEEGESAQPLKPGDVVAIPANHPLAGGCSRK